jgi:cytochrome oxidase assembly protein ShyY1
MGDVPANAGYAVTAYTLAAAMLFGYAVVLWRRGRRR